MAVSIRMGLFASDVGLAAPSRLTRKKTRHPRKNGMAQYHSDLLVDDHEAYQPKSLTLTMASVNVPIGSNGDEVIDNNVAGSDHATPGMRLTFIPVSRNQWTSRQSQNSSDTSHLSLTEMWIYGDQSTSSPYHAIGEVEAGYGNNQYVTYPSKSSGYASPAVATQGSVKAKNHENKHGEKTQKSSSKGKESSEEK
ncbi:hypothetical protein CHU98_g3226 [Xylaria longipes]|nr:hypothetical protein CHU98_g3226 [Xylaria longipes]